MNFTIASPLEQAENNLKGEVTVLLGIISSELLYMEIIGKYMKINRNKY